MTTSPPQAYPLKLEHVFFTKTVVVSVPNFKPGEGSLNVTPQNTINVSEVEGQPHRFEAVMRTVLNAEMAQTCPYFIDVECVAVIAADESLTQEDAKRGATINGHSVAYGAIREAVAWMTGRHPYGPFMLGFSVLQSKKPESKDAGDTAQLNRPAPS